MSLRKLDFRQKRIPASKHPKQGISACQRKCAAYCFNLS
jgi:hypothetical protein